MNTNNQSVNNGQTLTHKPFQSLPKPTEGKKRIDFNTGWDLVRQIMQRDNLTYSAAAYKVFNTYDVESQVKKEVFASGASFASAVNDRKRQLQYGYYKRRGRRVIRSTEPTQDKRETISTNTLQKRVSRNSIATVEQIKKILDLPIPDDVMVTCIRKIIGE